MATFHLITRQSLQGQSPRSVVANVLDCDIVVSEFEHQSRYYVHFWTNTLLEMYELPYPLLLWVK